jgi:hypothetical protein
MARLTAQITLGLLAAIAACLARAQETDLTLPPAIASGPGDVRLEPAAEEREDVLEAVVTGGQTDWRLPDLGSTFVSRIPEKNPDQRIDVTFLGLYDPENQDPTAEMFPDSEEFRRVNFLQIFELRFGKRNREPEPERD